MRFIGTALMAMTVTTSVFARDAWPHFVGSQLKPASTYEITRSSVMAMPGTTKALLVVTGVVEGNFCGAEGEDLVLQREEVAGAPVGEKIFNVKLAIADRDPMHMICASFSRPQTFDAHIELPTTLEGVTTYEIRWEIDQSMSAQATTAIWRIAKTEQGYWRAIAKPTDLVSTSVAGFPAPQWHVNGVTVTPVALTSLAEAKVLEETITHNIPVQSTAKMELMLNAELPACRDVLSGNVIGNAEANNTKAEILRTYDFMQIASFMVIDRVDLTERGLPLVITCDTPAPLLLGSFELVSSRWDRPAEGEAERAYPVELRGADGQQHVWVEGILTWSTMRWVTRIVE